ncbi:MAG TPA: 4Fe-4S dicluster domain-containing protein [Gemmatimonadales bacterium]|nr:4Fe-4S dicluster domain-containing protein [Gemmatimonadales bacterium]
MISAAGGQRGGGTTATGQQGAGAAPPPGAEPQGLTPGTPAWDSTSRVQLSPQAAAPLPHEPMGFYTDTTICIGCKACEVACKEWNQLPATGGGQHEMSGDSYDNTRRLDGIHWRHVKFIEQFSEDRTDGRWLMMSDVCKHCVNAPCLEVCPTGAIIRTEFDTVVIQSDTCNGCRACIGACPFGVIGINDVSKVAQKCTLCYDRLQAGMEPACSQACPTDSIRFGPIRELKQTAQARVEQLHSLGEKRAYLYGADDKFLGGLNSFYLLVDQPEVYGLPVSPKMPTRNLIPSSLFSTAGAVVLTLLGMVGLRKRRMDERAGEGDSHV